MWVLTSNWRRKPVKSDSKGTAALLTRACPVAKKDWKPSYIHDAVTLGDFFNQPKTLHHYAKNKITPSELSFYFCLNVVHNHYINIPWNSNTAQNKCTVHHRAWNYQFHLIQIKYTTLTLWDVVLHTVLSSDEAIFNVCAILRCPTVWWWWWYLVGLLLSDSMPVFYPSAQGLPHQHIVPNLGASVGSQSPIKQADHSDKVTDLMLSDLIKLSI